MKILVGSQNPAKIEAVSEAFSKYFSRVEVKGIGVKSNVAAQPIDQETFEGAKNRVLELKSVNIERKEGAKFLVGIEGGITKLYSRWFAFGSVCIMDQKGNTGFGTSPLFELPIKVVKEVLKGRELGDVMGEMVGKENIKFKEGAIGVFTKGVMERKHLYRPGVITALIPFLNQKLYFESLEEI